VKAAVVGGGLAGLAAALELTKARHEVTLYEARPTLGGAVQTLPEREGDPSPPPDNGQHIALNCFGEYIDFLAEIDSLRFVRRTRLSLPVIANDGSRAKIGRSPLALLRYRHLPPAERIKIARVLRELDRLNPGRHDDEAFADLLRRLGQSDEAIERFWDVFIRPALNISSEEASAALAIFTVQTALLGERGASDLILPTAPLGEMHGEAAGRALEAAGAAVRTRSRVMSLDDLDADVIVVAVPPAESARLLGEPDPGLEDSPIVSVHLLFDRVLLRHPLAALLGSPAHWVFDRGRLTGQAPSRGQYLTVVSSGAPELLEIRGRDLVDLMAAELTSRLGRADLLWSRVSREPAATFAGRPGTAAKRPGPDTGRRNVVRAGAWIDTGWPATMEGAVRSGRAAAALLAERVREKVPA
jgi:squalene-associated FAD-dependent desaturase